MNTVKTAFRNGTAMVGFATFLCLAVGAIPSTAAADNLPDGSRTRKVSLAGVDVTTAAGRAIAYGRVEAMARHLCFGMQESTDLAHSAHYLECVEQATAQARASIDAQAARLAGTLVAGSSTR